MQASSLGISSDLYDSSSESLPPSLSSSPRFLPLSSTSPPSLSLRLFVRMFDHRGRRCLRLPWKYRKPERERDGYRDEEKEQQGKNDLTGTVTLRFLICSTGSVFLSFFVAELCSSSSSSYSSSSSSSLVLVGSACFFCGFFFWLSATFELGLQVGKADDLQEKRFRWDEFIVTIKPTAAENNGQK